MASLGNPYAPVNNNLTSYSPRSDRQDGDKLKSLSSSPYKTLQPHGIEKFYISQNKKNVHREIEQVSNRINQLIKNEEKAKKKIEIAQKKAEQINRAKERHGQKIQEKEMHREVRKIEEDEQRRKNREEKERRFENIRAYQEAIFIDRKNQAEDVKKRSKEFDGIRKQFKALVEQEKNERKAIRYNEAAEHKHRKGQSQQVYTTYLKDEYEKRIIDEKNAHLELLNKKKELEKYEAELVNRLANTEITQTEVLKNLESLAKVSLFHLGLRP
jgi:hypothetical protein